MKGDEGKGKDRREEGEKERREEKGRKRGKEEKGCFVTWAPHD